MFSGIVQGVAPIVKLEKKTALVTLTIQLPMPLTSGLQRGASVALDGCCLTARSLEGNRVSFDAMTETLRLTTLGKRDQGDLVNVERAIKFGDEIGGHLVSGHVDGQAKITAIENSENNVCMTFKVPSRFIEYFFNKGYVSLDGCSLTVCNVNKQQASFQVYLIPETLEVTKFGQKTINDFVNFEIDSQTKSIVETVKAYLAQNLSKARLTEL